MISNRPKAPPHYPARPIGCVNRTRASTVAGHHDFDTAGCLQQAAGSNAPPPVEVTAITIAAKDTPVELEFVADTRSSRQVEIRARVEGFLEKRLYTEGEVVKAGQKMFQMDRKPFEAALQSAKGQLGEREAALVGRSR